MTPAKKPDRFPCPGCNGDMEFDPATGGMKCRFCGHTEAMATAAPSPEALKPHSLADFLAKGSAAELGTVSKDALEITCNGCGAVVVFEPPQIAGTCSFCGADLVAQPKAADPLIAPDAVLPAKVPKEKAQAEVRQWLQTRWFAPNALKRMARQEGIAGVYLPFWDYDADAFSRYRGERGQHYWETETYTEDDGRGGTVQRTRQVQRTAWYPAAGEVSRQFEDVLVAASKSVTEARLDALQPWDLESLCAYEPAYLSGFKAQRYQVELPGGLEKAKTVMQGEIEQDVRRAIGGDEQNIINVDTEYSNVMFRHLLLPVWIGAYRFQDRAYQVVVNARTGEVQGERPFSVVKITMLVAVILLVIFLLILVGKSR
jgi:ribosomal protein S27E